MNPVIKTLSGHRSIRRLTDDPVGEDNLTLIVKAPHTLQTGSTSGLFRL